MVRTRAFLSRFLYWSGLVVTLGAIALVIVAARKPSLTQIGIGFALGLVGMALTARGATMKRF